MARKSHFTDGVEIYAAVHRDAHDNRDMKTVDLSPAAGPKNLWHDPLSERAKKERVAAAKDNRQKQTRAIRAQKIGMAARAGGVMAAAFIATASILVANKGDAIRDLINATPEAPIQTMSILRPSVDGTRFDVTARYVDPDLPEPASFSRTPNTDMRPKSQRGVKPGLRGKTL